MAATAEYKPGYDTTSDAFAIEYDPSKHKTSLYKDIESYLGEYRFNLPAYTYNLNFTSNPDGVRQLRDPYSDTSMTEACQRAIEKRVWLGKDTSREHAELTGMQTINQYLDTAKDDDTLVWVSPPGAKEDGYGNYGFCYVGSVKQLPESNDKSLSMTAVRLEELTIEQCNQLMSVLHGQEISRQKPEEFLANPTILRGIQTAHIYNILPEIFNVNMDEKAQKRFKHNMNMLQPHVSKFIDMVKSGASRKELRKIFNAIEVYSDELRSAHQLINIGKSAQLYLDTPLTFDHLVAMYGDKIPMQVAGSCGSSGKSANIFSKFSSLSAILNNEGQGKNYSFDKEGQCVVCGTDPTKLGPCNICEPCDTKLRAEEQEPLIPL